MSLVRRLKADYEDALRLTLRAEPVAKTMEYLGQVESERDRLRAVVGTVRALFAEPVEPGEWAAADLGTEPYNRLLAALAALDGSADMGGDAGALIAEPSAPAESAIIPDEQGPVPAGDTRAFSPGGGADRITGTGPCDFEAEP